MTHLLIAARRYAAQGLSILPWTYHEGTKKPAVRWRAMQTTPWTDDDITRWWTEHPDHNIGLITGRVSGLVVIDADDEDACNWVITNLPPTPYTVTSSRGRHFGYAYPPDTSIRNATNIGGLHLDLRGEGGYIALPPSLHSSGQAYVWTNEEPDLHNLPTFIPAWLPKRQLQVLPGGIVNPLNAFERASKWMAKRDPAIQGSGGDNHTFATACTLVREFALPIPEAMKLLTAWNTTCIPPWTDIELRQKCESALHSGTAAIGSKDTKPTNIIDLKDWTDSLKPHPLTDMGNARRFAEQHQTHTRFVYDADRWYVWNSRHWEPDNSGATMRFAKSTTDSIRDEAKTINNPDHRAAAYKFAHISQSAGRLSAMLALAASEREIPAVKNQFDTDPMLLNVQNGILDLRTCILNPATPTGMHSLITATPYFPTPCPTWLTFLRDIFLDDDLIRYIQQLVGYCLTGDVNEHLFLYCYGTGRNGKSTFLNTIITLLGDYAGKTAPKLLIDRRNDPHPGELLTLYKKRFVLHGEVKPGDRLDEGKLKDLSGGERIEARGMRENFYGFEPTHKLWLTGNNKLRIMANDPGMWSRLKLLPFTVFIPPEHRDPNLKHKLWTEATGILHWAVQGCQDWLKNGFAEPECVTKAVNEYRADEDMFGQFFEEVCLTDNTYARTSRTAMRRAYSAWCSENGTNPMSARAVSSAIKELGFKSTDTGERFWIGIQLRGGWT